MASLALVVASSFSNIITERASVSTLWADHGSGSAHDVTIFSTVAPQGWVALSDYAQTGYSDAGVFNDWAPPYGPPLVVRELNSSGTLLAPPKGWRKLFTASASEPFTLWRAEARQGYAALGDVGTTNGEPPSSKAHTTVHTSCVVPCAADVMLWADKDGGVALYGARGKAGESISVGGFLADMAYPTGEGVAGFEARCLRPSCLSAMPVDYPEQIHVALGRSPDHMAVQWASAVGVHASKLCARGGEAAHVLYGLRGAARTHMASAECTSFNVGASQLTQELWNATLSGLEPMSAYEYEIVSGDARSAVFGFTTAPDGATLAASLPHQFVVYGDLGHGLPQSSSTVMPYASRDVRHGPPGLKRRSIDMVLHVGDFAYDFDSAGGTTGRNFMNDIMNYSAHVPYMISHGNHESGFNFAHCTEYFRSQPSDTGVVATGASQRSPNNWWFSWNYGLVHFVTISTEIPFDHPAMVPSMVAWLEQDLKLASANRSSAPWIVVHGHRPLYCSCDGDCDGAATTMRVLVEHLFYQYGVDLYICGHEHNYERMYDVAPKPNVRTPWLSGVTTKSTKNMPATTYIVVGSAGNVESHERFTRKAPPRTALALNEYGYGRLIVHNASHLQWQFVVTDGSQSPPTYDILGDDVMLVQEKHGPFDVPVVLEEEAS